MASSLSVVLSSFGEVEALHLDEDADAPGVGQPVREVRVVVGRAAPHHRAVLHRVAVGVALLLVGLEHQLADLVEGLHDARLQAAVHLVVPLAEELVAGTDELGCGVEFISHFSISIFVCSLKRRMTVK